MALLKKETEHGEPVGGGDFHSCVDDYHGKQLAVPVTATFSMKAEVAFASESCKNAGSVPESQAATFETADTCVKGEQNPILSTESNTEVPMETNIHSDHTYTSEERVVKQEYLQSIQPDPNATQAGQNVQSYPSAEQPLKQEVKVCPQSCQTGIKKEVRRIKPVGNIYIKTEAPDDNGGGEDNTVSDSHGLQYSYSPTYKCSKCNSSFANEQLLKIHIAKCGLNGDSVTSFVKTVKSMPASKMRKCNQCDYSSHTTKKLIETVRKHPCLYRTDHEDCRNTQLKTAIWASIASECNLPSGSIAKVEWQKLKSSFIDIAKRQNSIQNGHSRKQPRWKYYHQMEFILPYVTNRPSSSEVQGEHCSNGEEVAQIVQVQESPEVNDLDEDAEEECMVASAPPAKKAKIVAPQVASFSKAPQRSILELREGLRPATSSLDMFFLSMCETTKNLPPYVQLQVKKKIFQAVIEAEEIVAAMNNDQEKNGMFQSSSSVQDEYPNNMSPFSVQSANEDASWQED